MYGVLNMIRYVTATKINTCSANIFQKFNDVDYPLFEQLKDESVLSKTEAKPQLISNIYTSVAYFLSIAQEVKKQHEKKG